MDIEELKNRWISLLDNIVNSPITPDVPNDLFATICTKYYSNHRFYHTLKHVKHMLDKIDELNNTNLYYIFNSESMKLATWYHDIYYKPFNFDARLSNEFFSSARARRELSELNINADIIGEVGQLIMLTQTHKTNQYLEIPLTVQKIFLDSDMSILGETPEKYLEYAHGIEDECMSYNVLTSPMFYYEKRKEFLLKTLKNKPIFHTEYMQEHYEGPAELNMQREILNLDKLIEEELREE
jgi:predicted metal-dependent HD superfamily phosphohydrolase